jgi:hypothetical protein
LPAAEPAGGNRAPAAAVRDNSRHTRIAGNVREVMQSRKREAVRDNSRLAWIADGVREVMQ